MLVQLKATSIVLLLVSKTADRINLNFEHLWIQHGASKEKSTEEQGGSFTLFIFCTLTKLESVSLQDSKGWIMLPTDFFQNTAVMYTIPYRFEDRFYTSRRRPKPTTKSKKRKLCSTRPLSPPLTAPHPSSTRRA